MANSAIEDFLNSCERGDMHLFKQLLRKVNINDKNENGYSGLALAVRNGYIDIAYELAREDADINSVNEVFNYIGWTKCIISCLLT